MEEPSVERLESQIVRKACELSEALRDAAYTRKEDDKKRVSLLQMEIMLLCRDYVSNSSSGNTPSST